MDNEEVKADDKTLETSENVNSEEILEEEETTTEENKNDLIELLEKEKEELNNRYLRLQADFDNFRKRTIKEKEETLKYALADFAEKMLPIIDNMERAIESIDDNKIEDPYVDGVKMVFEQLSNTLIAEGLEVIKTEKAEFDPQLHHGVAVEDADEFEDNQIIEVYQKGYKYKDKVIRPAMVKICKK